ncbi:MAG: hypothetical protein Q4F56_01640 [Candidatus Saccharibacteria bacterium]|nr:hypothetical protein [Candidatus Saccharibacteria bacterium]
MSVLTSLGILVLIALILAFMQLVPGVFSLLLHFASGKFSKNQKSDLATFFILGAETFIVLTLLLTYIIFSNSPTLFWTIDNPIFSWILAGILIAFGILIFILYFRRGSQTELFISRQLAQNYQAKAQNTKTRSDAFTLGFTSALPEFIFTFPLYLVAIITTMQTQTNTIASAGTIILLAIIAILPLLISHFLSAHGYTLADSLRFRTHNRTFFRLCLPLFYFLTALLIILGVSS